MKRHTPAGQKGSAAVVLALSLLSAAYCLGGPSEALGSELPAPPAALSAAAQSSAPAVQRPDMEQLEEHGYYIDALVNRGPLDNRQAPRHAYRKTEQRQYSRQAADQVVETILDSIITPDMDASQQCSAVYYYIKGCITCDGTSVKSDWRQAAYWGFTTGKGDEYTFYACSRALLTGLGFQVQEVKRESDTLTEPHSWSLVNYGAGWYHFDPCPHLKRDPLFICCLSTDQQLMDFNAEAKRDYYAFDPDAYPERMGGPAVITQVSPLPVESENPLATPSSAVTPTPSPTSSAAPTPTPEPEATPTPTPVPEPTPPPAPVPDTEEPLLPPGA
ncbi:transglutaminase-like domain-containing protein [Vermiculatibacterium agrestimuris]|uniref:transglutaminase-like domain-containing protein n=1 Tax=Vermiculatibacterium agrestimuris TaxID=2941519 RepID=UPI00203D61D3|nr:transglutaminase-like domain-containing protein [Vermiculatibacterium agrestimuris]